MSVKKDMTGVELVIAILSLLSIGFAIAAWWVGEYQASISASLIAFYLFWIVD